VQWWNDQPEQMRIRAAELIARPPDVAVTSKASIMPPWCWSLIGMD